MVEKSSPARTRRDALPRTLTFRFFDVDLQLTSNSEPLLARFMALYARCRVTAARTTGMSLAVTLMTPDSSGETDTATLTLGNTAYPVTEYPRWLPYIVDVIIQAALHRVHSHYLIHSAALTRNGRACLLIGRSGWGKSTLALALAQRGLHLLSDEIGALDDRGSVTPFLRTVRLRPPSPSLLGLAQGSVTRQDNWVLVNALPHAPATDTPKLTHIFVLDHGAVMHVPRGSRLLLTGATPGLCHALRMHPEVRSVTGRIPHLEVHTSATAPPSTVEEICRRCRQAQALVLEVTAAEPTRPVFPHAPDITPLTPTDALFDVLPHLMGGRVATVRQGRQGAGDGHAWPNAGALLADLATVFHGVRSFRLTPGAPEATASLIVNLMDESETVESETPWCDHRSAAHTNTRP